MIATLLSVPRYRWIFMAAILGIAAAHVKAVMWLEWPFRVALLDSVVSNVPLVITMLAILNGLRYYLPREDRFVYAVVWCLGLSLLNVGIVWYLLPQFVNEPEYGLFVERSFLLRQSIQFLLLLLVALLHVIWFQQQQHASDEENKAETERLAREAELFNIRQQVQPHFLFNSLNSINALIGSRPEEARNMVQQLSEFLRGTLRKDHIQSVTLEDELHLLRLYLNIEKVRFGHRLNVNITCSDPCRMMKLPPLLIQPVVENAIKFGLYDTVGQVTIDLEVTCMPDMLKIQVRNPFDPETSKPQQGTGFGLVSIQRRLYLLFARNDLLETHTDNNLFSTTISIPQTP